MKVIHLAKIDSTQNYSKELLLSGERDFIVYSDIQNSGRGRHGRKWEAPNGGLWFSFDMDYNDYGELFTIAIGVVVREECANNYKCDVKLKWPNDIIVNDKKVGGIICEKVGEKVIVGIGLNTNLEKVNCENSDTFFNITGKRVDNNIIMESIRQKCKEIIYKKNIDVVKKFREHMAFKGKKCFVSALGKEVEILDIGDNGYLVVKENEKKHEIFMGEINLCI